MKRTNLKRVKVVIQNRDGYARGCADSLDGMTGSVEKERICGKQVLQLVRFDKPAKKWWGGQLPVNSFWIPQTDLCYLMDDEEVADD